MILVFLRGIVVPPQIKELAAEQSDTVCIPGQGRVQILGGADVGAYQYPTSVRGNGLASPKALQITAVVLFRPLALAQLGGGVRVGRDIDPSVGAVHKGVLAIVVGQQAVP